MCLAAPIVTELSAAVLMQAVFEGGEQYNPFLIKNILASTADDTNNDPFVQGSGIVNISRAVEFATGGSGSFLIYNDATYPNLLESLDQAYESFNLTKYDLKRVNLMNRPLQQYEWFAGHLYADEHSQAIFTVENPSNLSIMLQITPVQSVLVEEISYNGTTQTHLKDPIIKDEDAFAPQYILLSDVRPHSGIADYFAPKDIPDNANLLVLHLRFAFDDFLNQTETMYANKTQVASIYLYDWIDYNNDTIIASDEISMINRGVSWGNVQEMRVENPASRFEGTPVVGVFAPPHVYSYWHGVTEENATLINYTITAQYYRHERWNDIWLEDGMLEIPAKGSASLRAILTVPHQSQTGAYQGALKFQDDERAVIVPVSYAVKEQIESDVPARVYGMNGGLLFDAQSLEGATSFFSNYASGGWRQFYFEVSDPEINLGSAYVSWKDPGTQLTIFAIDPSGNIAASTADPGVYGELDNSASSDWLGRGVQGWGGFYPVTNINSTSVGLYIPINQTGTWSLLAHSAVYGGMYEAEPVDLLLKFTDLRQTISNKVYNQTGGRYQYMTDQEGAQKSGLSRRDFLRLMGPAVHAGLAYCAVCPVGKFHAYPSWHSPNVSSILWPVFPQTPQMQTDHTICSKRRHILFFSTKTFWKSDKLPLAKCFLVKNSVSGFWIRYNFSMVCWKRCDVCLRTIWELDWNTFKRCR